MMSYHVHIIKITKRSGEYVLTNLLLRRKLCLLPYKLHFFEYLEPPVRHYRKLVSRAIVTKKRRWTGPIKSLGNVSLIPKMSIALVKPFGHPFQNPTPLFNDMTPPIY